MIPPRETWFEGKLKDRLVDNGDGTGILYVYGEDGETIVDTIEQSDLPIVEESINLDEPVLPSEIAIRMREAFDAAASGSLTVTKLKLAMQAAIDAIGEPT